MMQRIRAKFERLRCCISCLERKVELFHDINELEDEMGRLAVSRNVHRIEGPDAEQKFSAGDQDLMQIERSEQSTQTSESFSISSAKQSTRNIVDLPGPILQEIYGFVPELVCSHTAVCKWFFEVLPESKAVELRVLRGRGVREDYMRRFSSKDQKILLVVRDHNKNFDFCIVRALLSVFESTIANVVSMDFTGMLSEKFLTDQDDETEKARNRIGFYITGLVKHATNLERLILKQNDFSDKMGTMIAAGMSERSGLKEVDLSFNRFENYAVIALASSIFRNTRLERISLAGNRICETAMEAISVAIEACPTLTDIDVGGQGRYISTFFPGMISNTRIRRFSAASSTERWNAVKTCMILSECFCQLVSLDLSLGFVGTEGCRYLARALRRFTSLERLVLSGCGIAEEGSRHLASNRTAPIVEFRSSVEGRGNDSDETRVHGDFGMLLLLPADDPFADVLPECLTRLESLHSLQPGGAGPLNDSAVAGLTLLKTLDFSRNPGRRLRRPSCASRFARLGPFRPMSRNPAVLPPQHEAGPVYRAAHRRRARG